MTSYGRPAEVVENKEVPGGNEKAFEELEARLLSNNIQRTPVLKSTHFQNNIRTLKLSALCSCAGQQKIYCDLGKLPPKKGSIGDR